MQENKVYILQKDMGDLRAGAKFEKIGNNYLLISHYATIMPQTIENNPDFFMPEENKPKEEERITVNHLEPIEQMTGLSSIKDFYYDFKTSKPIPKDKFPKIKEAIESVVNDDKKNECLFDVSKVYEKFKELYRDGSYVKQEEKDWEIQSFISPNDNCILLQNKEDKNTYGKLNLPKGYILTNTYFKIHSVLRKSDNEVFTIGDKIEYGTAFPINLRQGCIIGFNIREDKMIFAEIEKDIFFPITHLHKLKIENKTCLSLNDLLSVWDEALGKDNTKKTSMYKRFEQLVKDKISKQ